MGVLFFLLRGVERWLHQHIFKVGWLLTHNYDTTTILYYTFFLPGVLLHEVVYWLMAGVMNVRADRSIEWPKAQEIGDLKLNFIKLAPKAHPIQRAIIATTPLFTGLLAIWLIAIHIFQLETVITIAGNGQIEDVANALRVLTSTPDFWLWFYISFTIANTMFPNIPKDMRGWWQVVGAIGVIISVLVILGISQTVITDITLSLTQLVNSLSLILVITLLINFLMVLGLGLIEYTIEHISGHSATFKNGKMITMTREEAKAFKEAEQTKQLRTPKSTPRRRTTTDITSIYAFDLPIPGSPTQEPVTKGVTAILGIEKESTESKPSEDDIIEGTVTGSMRQRHMHLFAEASSADTDPEAISDEPALHIPDSVTEITEQPTDKQSEPVDDIASVVQQVKAHHEDNDEPASETKPNTSDAPLNTLEHTETIKPQAPSSQLQFISGDEDNEIEDEDEDEINEDDTENMLEDDITYVDDEDAIYYEDDDESLYYDD